MKRRSALPYGLTRPRKEFTFLLIRACTDKIYENVRLDLSLVCLRINSLHGYKLLYFLGLQDNAVRVLTQQINKWPRNGPHSYGAKTDGGTESTGVENAGRSGVRRRNGTCWTTNAPRRTWQDMTTGHTVVFSSWRPWATQWVLTLKHCVSQRIAAAAAMRMRRHRRQRQRQTRHYDMILWLYNLMIDFS